MKSRETIEKETENLASSFARAGLKLDLDGTILQVLLDIRDLLQAKPPL